MHESPEIFGQLQQLYADGEAALAAGQFDQAIALFSKGLSIDDHFRQRYITMYAQRAFAHLRLQHYAEAVDDYTKAIAMEPEINQAQYYFQRGMCRVWLGGQDGDAEADFTSSIKLHDRHPGPFHLRGKLRFDQGRYVDAIADFDRALALHAIPECVDLKAKAQAALASGAQAAQQAVASGAGGDADPLVFPGQKLAKLSDYVGLMKGMQAGDMMGALARYGLDMTSYAAAAQAWGAKLATDPVLTEKFSRMMAAR